MAPLRVALTMSPTSIPVEPPSDDLFGAPPELVAASAQPVVAKAETREVEAPQADGAKTLLQMAKYTGPKDRKKKYRKDKTVETLLPQSDAPAAAAVTNLASEAQEVRPGDAEEEDEGTQWRRMVADDWKMVQALKDKEKDGKGKESEGTGDLDEDDERREGKNTSTVRKGSGGLFGFGRKAGKADTDQQEDKGSKSKGGGKGSDNGIKIPDNFDDMVLFNARMIGANVPFIEMILKLFNTLVGGVVNKDDFRLQKETRVISLRLYAEKFGKVMFKEFKICMLASLRPLLPSTWDAQHEKAWETLWDTIAQLMSTSIDLPQKYHRLVNVMVNDMDLEEKRSLGLAVFKRLFKLNPQTEYYFKQNNERLAFIVRRAMEFSMQIFDEPAKVMDDLTALGLKHIMWSIPTEYFEPFIICCVQEVQERCGKPDVLEGFAWALEIVASTLVLTIEDGTTPLLKAVLQNNPKSVRKELGKLPRAQRAATTVGATAIVE